MSSLPSLLKSPTPTPSERKLGSRTVFFQVMRGEPDLAPRHGQRLALFADQHRRDLVGRLAQRLREAGEVLAALRERQGAPGGKCVARRTDRPVELLARSVGAPGERLLGCWIDHVESACRSLSPTVDGMKEGRSIVMRHGRSSFVTDPAVCEASWFSILNGLHQIDNRQAGSLGSVAQEVHAHDH